MHMRIFRIRFKLHHQRGEKKEYYGKVTELYRSLPAIE